MENATFLRFSKRLAQQGYSALSIQDDAEQQEHQVENQNPLI